MAQNLVSTQNAGPGFLSVNAVFYTTGGLIPSIVVAISGAVILVLLVRALRRA